MLRCRPLIICLTVCGGIFVGAGVDADSTEHEVLDLVSQLLKESKSDESCPDIFDDLTYLEFGFKDFLWRVSRKSQHTLEIWKYLRRNGKVFKPLPSAKGTALKHAVEYLWSMKEPELVEGPTFFRFYYDDTLAHNYRLRKEFRIPVSNPVNRLELWMVNVNGIYFPDLRDYKSCDKPADLIELLGFTKRPENYGYQAPVGKLSAEVDLKNRTSRLLANFYQGLSRDVLLEDCKDLFSDVEDFYLKLPKAYRESPSKLQSVWRYLRDYPQLFLMPGMTSSDTISKTFCSMTFYNISPETPVFDAQRSVSLYLSKFHPGTPAVDAAKRIEFYLVETSAGPKIKLSESRISGISIDPVWLTGQPLNLYEILGFSMDKQAHFTGLYRSKGNTNAYFDSLEVFNSRSRLPANVHFDKLIRTRKETGGSYGAL